jgi:hypothetical protein
MARSCVVGVLALTAFVPAAPAQDSQGDRRILPIGRPIVEQLRPGDRRVVLPINRGPVQFGTPPAGISPERHLLDVSTLVAVLDVQRVVSRLVYRDDMDRDAVIAGTFSGRNVPASEDRANWVISSIRVRVEDVLKGAPALKEGDQLLVQDDGGSAMVRGVEVVAAVPWQAPLVSGKRYLFFGHIVDDGRLFRTATYEEPSPFAFLVNIGPQKGDGDRLETFNLEDALVHLRVVARASELRDRRALRGSNLRDRRGLRGKKSS